MYEIFEQLLQTHGVTAYKVSKETGITQSTLSDWKRGRSTPKTESMRKIAAYFGVSLEYLMTGEEKEEGDKYYLNEETTAIAQKIFERKELRMMFDAAKNSTAERLLAYYNMIVAMEKAENHDED